MSHKHQSLLDRRLQAAQLAVLLYELCGVLSASKHLYGLLVCGGCLDPLRSTGCGVVPVHLCVLLPLKDDVSNVPGATSAKTLALRFGGPVDPSSYRFTDRNRGAAVQRPPQCLTFSTRL